MHYYANTLVVALGAVVLSSCATRTPPKLSPCTIVYHAFGGQTDSGERARPEDLEGASLYFLDIDNWPGQRTLASLSFSGGGIVAQSKFRDGKATVTFPEGQHHKVTVVAVQGSKRFWAVHDRKALPFFDKPPLHEFVCSAAENPSSRR